MSLYVSLGAHVHALLLGLYLGPQRCHSHVKTSLAFAKMNHHTQREANQLSQCTSCIQLRE